MEKRHYNSFIRKSAIIISSLAYSCHFLHLPCTRAHCHTRMRTGTSIDTYRTRREAEQRRSPRRPVRQAAGLRPVAHPSLAPPACTGRRPSLPPPPACTGRGQRESGHRVRHFPAAARLTPCTAPLPAVAARLTRTPAAPPNPAAPARSKCEVLEAGPLAAGSGSPLSAPRRMQPCSRSAA